MNERIQQALAFFVKQGWTPEQSAGIVANLQAESGMRPDAIGDGGASVGIAQWHPPRQSNFAGLMGKPIQGSSFEDQLYFVHAELRGTEKAAGDKLAACTNATEAGSCISRYYERPADLQGEMLKRAALAEKIFAEYGGSSVGGGTPAPDTQVNATANPVTPQQPEKPAMGALALLQLFGPILSGMIPQIAPLLNPSAATKLTQGAGIAQVVLDTINKTTGQANLQGSIEAMQRDPVVKQAVQAAVITHPEVIGLMEVGGGIKAARVANLEIQNAEKGFWFNPAFWVTLLLLPMAYWIVGSVLIGGVELDENSWQIWKMFGRAFDAETRSGMVNLVIGMVLGGIVGIWFGTSYGSMRKTELAATATSEAVAK